jgi:transcriptional regulator with XRE-family HTH domain
VRLRCHLRELRGKRSLRELAEEAGLNHGTLSQIERGVLLPRDEQVYAIGKAYGAPPTEWYSELGLLAIQDDVPIAEEVFAG